MCEIFFEPKLNQGKELILNIARLLSKVSLDFTCAAQIVDSGKLQSFVTSMHTTHKEHSAVLIRIAYILGNLTTNFEEARLELNADHACTMQKMVELSCYYLHKEANPRELAAKPEDGKKTKSKYEEFTQGGLEDALTKVVKLIANLSTDEEAAQRDLKIISKD